MGSLKQTRVTGRHLLPRGVQEEKGYGLYSYVLFGCKPDKTTLERFVRTIEEYQSLMPRITAFEDYFPRHQLNVTYIPVVVEGPDTKKMIHGELSSTEWAIENYDYARARAILSKLGPDYRDGPYIVSFFRPPLETETAPRPYVVMDLSKVPVYLIRAWVKEFLNQAAQEQYWKQRSLARFVLNVRTIIAIASVGLPESEKAVRQRIKLVA
jgi:hypothetical protein